MDAGRNFENPSRLGLDFLSNSFIAHPFSLDFPCAARTRTLTEYRRLEKRKSRMAGSLPTVESLNCLRFSPPRSIRVHAAAPGGPVPHSRASSVPSRRAGSARETGGARAGFHV